MSQPVRSVGGVLWVFAAWTLPVTISSAEVTRPSSTSPNFVFILIDDLGWADVRCFGSTLHETPSIDRLAREGMRFANAYAACPVCSPTRASILTGKYPARLRLTDYLKGRRSPPDSPLRPAEYADQLALDETTIAEALKTRGYATGHVGKWHLGGSPYFPQHQGFDVNVAGSSSGAPKSFFWPRWEGNPPIRGTFDGEYLTDLLTTEACRFIEGHAESPFFLYFAHYAVHIPIEGKEEKIEKYKAKLREEPPAPGSQQNPYYASMVESVDESVGRVLGTLDRLGIAERTAVFFFSDNGGLSVVEGKHTPATTNAPLRAGKGYLYEGGIREPLIVRWPAEIRAGTVCEVSVTSVDFFPTICELAGIDPRRVARGPLDGVSLATLLRNPEARLEREALFWHYPHFSNQGGRPGAAVRVGNWKLIEFYESGSLELYDLESDVGETRNLAAERPEQAASLRARLDRWRKEVDANMPRPNPDARPQAPKAER